MSKDVQDAQLKIEEYTQFVNNALKPQLKEAKQSLEETEEEISEYTKLLAAIQQLYTEDKVDDSVVMGRKQRGDLGYQTVYCKATVGNMKTDESTKATTTRSPAATAAGSTNTSNNDHRIYVHVGLGFHAELDPKQAIDFCIQRVEFLKDNKLYHRQKHYTRLYDHYQSSINILEELEKVQ